MMVNKERMWKRIQELGRIGATPEGGVSRFAFTPEDDEAVKMVEGWMKEIGLKVRRDAAGNLFGRLEGMKQEPVVMTGSHLDSVLNGGKFDGAAGVVAALEVLQHIRENNNKTQLPIEMVAFSNEEGSRFPGGLMGSLAVAGRLTGDYAYGLEDKDKVTLAEELLKRGLEPGNMINSGRSDIKHFLELHIEQAKVLEENDIPVGIVTGIAGPCQMLLNIYGRSGHSGAVPMDGRQDPMVVAGMVIQEVERSALEAAATTRGTVGYISSKPGGHNIIPAEVELTLDYRDIDAAARQRAVERIKGYIASICIERNISYRLTVTQDAPPTMIGDKMTGLLKRTADELQIPALLMPSGAAHDAMIMSNICDIGMIFVRSRDGLSHCPGEFTSKDDLELAAEILLNSVIKLANEDISDA